MSINGTYVLDKNENLEPFLLAVGFKEETVKKLAAVKPTITVNLSGGKLVINSKGKDEVTNTLTLGAPSTYKFASGFEIEVNVNTSGNTIKGSVKMGEKTGEITTSVTDTELTEVFNVAGVTMKRIYKRI